MSFGVKGLLQVFKKSELDTDALVSEE